MPDYADSYLGQLRQLIGKRKIFALGVRAIIQDDEGRILLVQRNDNAKWVMVGGSMELEESVFEACQREVREEAGLQVEEATLIAVYSDPRYSIITAYGDPYQLVSFVFRVDKWSGELVKQTDETLDADFYALDELPQDLPDMYHETLEDLERFDGTVIMK